MTDDLRRGAVFYDVNAKAPYRPDVFGASIKDGKANTLHRRLFIVETTSAGDMLVRQPTLLLDISPAPKGTTVPGDSHLPDRWAVEHSLVESALQPFLAEVAAQRDKEVDTISRHMEISLGELIHRQNLQLAELVSRQQVGVWTSGIHRSSFRRLSERQDCAAAIGRHRPLGQLNLLAGVVPRHEPGFEGISSSCV